MRAAVSSFTFSAGIVARYNAVYWVDLRTPTIFQWSTLFSRSPMVVLTRLLRSPALVGIELWVIGTIYTALEDKDNALFWLERG
jgi:hypothetical protein